MSEVLYRDATLADLPAIVSIYNSTVPGRMVTADLEMVTTHSRLSWFHEHTPDRRPLWIIETTENEIAGWISFQDFYGREAYNATAEISIYLHPVHRGKGLGAKALQHAFSQCPKLGIKTLVGYIFAHNEPSLKLFRNMGFEEWGTLPDIAELDGIERSVKILGIRIT